MLAATPVTQGQWKALMGGSNPSHFQGDDLPVETVTWQEAVEFCERLSRKEGKHYRLPTESEWEYACRAGTTGAFGAGDGEASLDQVGWYAKNSGDQTHAVGQKKPNAWGLFDMQGNVCQWCSDWCDTYPAGDVTDPQGATVGTGRIMRGVAWSDSAAGCRSGASVLRRSARAGEHGGVQGGIGGGGLRAGGIPNPRVAEANTPVVG